MARPFLHIARRLSVPLLLALAGCSQSNSGARPPLIISQGWRLQDASLVTDSPERLSRPGYRPNGWHSALVPGTVLTSLVADGTYPEPLYGENNRPDKIPESLCRASYWYRTELTMPAATPEKRLWLNFEGVNYTAEVWVMFAAPLLIGCDLSKLDPFTLNLLTNDEVLDINQDALGKQATRVARLGQVSVYIKPLEDGGHAVCFLNLGAAEAAIEFTELAAHGLSGPQQVRDVWRQKDLPQVNGSLKATVNTHGVALLKLSPAK